MPGLKSRLLYFAMKNRHVLKGQWKQPAWDENTSILDFRKEAEGVNGVLARLPAGVSVESLTVCGLPAEWLTVAGASKERTILYCIGGGYVSGSCSDHRSLVARIAKSSQVNVLLLQHRLAPEHPYPAAVEDMLDGYRWLLEQGFAPAGIVLVGESAGGGLCLATLLAIRDRGLPLPARAVAMSPWTDLTLSGESHRTKAKVCLSPPGMAEVCVKHYLAGQDPRHPWASPLYGDLHGLPPLLISVGEYETLLDDSTRFAAKARAAGVDVTLRVGEGMIHCYPLLAGMFPEATRAMEEIGTFING
jgi:epsilon-lactone hydrolase